MFCFRKIVQQLIFENLNLKNLIEKFDQDVEFEKNCSTTFYLILKKCLKNISIKINNFFKDKIMKNINFDLNDVIHFGGQQVHEITNINDLIETIKENTNLSKQTISKFITELENFEFKPCVHELDELSIVLDDVCRYLAVPLELSEFYKITGSGLVNYDRNPIYNYVDDKGIIYCCFSSYKRHFNIVEIEKHKLRFYHLKDIDNELFKNFTKKEKEEIETIIYDNNFNYLDIFFKNKKVYAVEADANLTLFMTMLNMASIPITPFAHIPDRLETIIKDHIHNINYDYN